MIMHISKLAFVAGAAFALATLAQPASAQKSADTLRLAVISPFAALSTYDLPHEEAAVFSREIYDFLMTYDEHNKKYVPGLAKSWKRVDDKTLEIELRDDVKFHNGNKFDSADVKATLDYLLDPKSKITYQGRYNWVRELEILGPHKIRVHAVEPTATDLNTLAYRFQMWDAETLNALADKGDYSRTQVMGTGIYKMVSFDRNKGVLVERNDAYNTTAVKKAPIKRIQGTFIPDRETQAAQLMTGGIDWIRGATPDAAKHLSANPNLKVSYVASPTFVYIALDSQNLSGNKALSDHRVRKAIHKAIDREAIIKYLVPGGEVAEHVQGLCFKATIDCEYQVQAEKLDVEGAKKLMAEAGYANGFDMQYDVFAPAKAIGEAIAGDLRKIGVRANMNVVDLSLYRRKQGDGKLEAWSILFPTGSYPDIGNIFSVFFTGPAFKYYNDPIIQEAMDKGEAEFDSAKRAAIYGKALNRINEMNYILPISSVPVLHVHSKDAKVNTNVFSAGETYAADFQWN
jgi:peptide/nickel transport system substrate-binding protein